MRHDLHTNPTKELPNTLLVGYFHCHRGTIRDLFSHWMLIIYIVWFFYSTVTFFRGYSDDRASEQRNGRPRPPLPHHGHHIDRSIDRCTGRSLYQWTTLPESPFVLHIIVQLTPRYLVQFRASPGQSCQFLCPSSITLFRVSNHFIAQHGTTSVDGTDDDDPPYYCIMKMKVYPIVSIK